MKVVAQDEVEDVVQHAREHSAHRRLGQPVFPTRSWVYTERSEPVMNFGEVSSLKTDNMYRINLT